MKLLLFESVHRVMKAEKLLAGAGVPCEMLPTPREYSKECGMCIGVAPGDEERARALLGRVVHTIVDRKEGN